jgi:hypothetical protein
MDNSGASRGEIEEARLRSPDAAQRAALAEWCAADPGSTQYGGCLSVPALRCTVKNAAPRPGHMLTYARNYGSTLAIRNVKPRTLGRPEEISPRLLLAGAGGVGLQRPDALGQGAAAPGNFGIGGRAVGGSRRPRRSNRFGGQYCLDRRIRPLDLHREFGDFGGDIVDAFA